MCNLLINNLFYLFNVNGTCDTSLEFLFLTSFFRLVFIDVYSITLESLQFFSSFYFLHTILYIDT